MASAEAFDQSETTTPERTGSAKACIQSMLVVFRQPRTDSSADSRLSLFTAAISRGRL
jgi:hypothetical protein